MCINTLFEDLKVVWTRHFHRSEVSISSVTEPTEMSIIWTLDHTPIQTPRVAKQGGPWPKAMVLSLCAGVRALLFLLALTLAISDHHSRLYEGQRAR